VKQKCEAGDKLNSVLKIVQVREKKLLGFRFTHCLRIRGNEEVSRLDAYGVGKTILKAYNGAFGGSPTEYDQVPRIAQLLALESPDRRITLKDALDQLKSTSAKVTNVLPQQAAQVSPDTAETKRRECRASDD
jgi:hypothetical protein